MGSDGLTEQYYVREDLSTHLVAHFPMLTTFDSRVPKKSSKMCNIRNNKQSH